MTSTQLFHSVCIKRVAGIVGRVDFTMVDVETLHAAQRRVRQACHALETRLFTHIFHVTHSTPAIPSFCGADQTHLVATFQTIQVTQEAVIP